MWDLILLCECLRLLTYILIFIMESNSLNYIQIGVHLWATGEETVSFHSFLILQDVASGFSSDCFDLCLIKMYKAFIGHCKFAEPALFKHLQFLRNSFVELCSQDLLRSSNKAKVSINNLSRILQLGLQTKKKVCCEHVILISLFS